MLAIAVMLYGAVGLAVTVAGVASVTTPMPVHHRGGGWGWERWPVVESVLAVVVGVSCVVASVLVAVEGTASFAALVARLVSLAALAVFCLARAVRGAATGGA